MKKTLIFTLFVLTTTPFVAYSLETGDLAPTKEQVDRAADRAEQERGQREHARQQERDRVRSQAERNVDKIPKETTVRPIYKDGGGGVKVIIPNK